MAGVTIKELFRNPHPVIQNAVWSSYGPAWGDLERLGLAVKHRARTGKYSVEEWWEYIGDDPVDVSGRLMYKGDTTDKFEKDYS